MAALPVSIAARLTTGTASGALTAALAVSASFTPAVSIAATLRTPEGSR